MKTTRLLLLSVSILASLALLTGCQPASRATISPTLLPTPTPLSTAAPEPSTVPTVLSSPTSDPFPPEIVATKPADIAGTWRISYAGAGETFKANLTLRDDSTFSFARADDPSPIFEGVVRFVDGKVILESDKCFDVLIGTGPCSMTFTVYSSLQNGKPLRLRFESDDPQQRIFIRNFKHRYLLPVP
jgi:hypothetical protein